MTYLFDTNLCIAFLRGVGPASLRVRVAASLSGDACLCSVVRAELIYGALLSGQGERRNAEMRAFLDDFVSLPFDDSAANLFGPIRAGLERAGNRVGVNDLMIAAIALSRDPTLVTHNTRDFARISSLRIEDWEAA